MAVVAAAALLTGGGGIHGPHVAKAVVCFKEWTGNDASTSAFSDGGKMAWRARSMSATDTGSGGFSAQVLWVGTNNSSDTLRWVEAGITQGWQGANILTAYTAHGDYSVTPHIYAEHRWTSPSITPGDLYTFAGFYNTTNTYRTTINTNANSWDWSGHTSGTNSWSGGSESTCGPTGVVSNTYVSVNQYRRSTDHVYVNAAVGSLFTDVDGGSAWCSSPVTFRYWLNNGTTGCS